MSINKNRIKLAAAFLFSMGACTSIDGQKGESKEFRKLSEWMAGSFSSMNQHHRDTVNYFDIRLQIIPIWKNRNDGRWYYVEQAVSAYEDEPYRQRVYHLSETEPGKFESVVLTLTEPLRFAGKPEMVEKLSPDSLKEKEGCSVILYPEGSEQFTGSTVGKNCPSDRSGASYTKSEVTITKGMLKSWDRGYNDKDEQVWGATQGPYEFVKIGKAK